MPATGLEESEVSYFGNAFVAFFILDILRQKHSTLRKSYCFKEDRMRMGSSRILALRP